MNKDRVVTIVSSFLLAVLFFITVSYRYYNAVTAQDVLIAEDVKVLADIFDRINASCQIIGFEHEKNYIDFLNVESFVGSEVGLMNLAHPENWEGPYLNDNPTMQEKYYMIIKTDMGYYIVPGDGGPHCSEVGNKGVHLANGKMIGRDILFTTTSNMDALMQNPDQLLSEAGALAARINVGK